MPKSVAYTTQDELRYIEGIGKKNIALGKEAYRSKRISLLQGQLVANLGRDVWGDINPTEVRVFIHQQIAALR